jgi:hypothetical protein
MKYYESHFEEYISAVEKFNLHPELSLVYNRLPRKMAELENVIIYGPSGVGKYSQILNILKKYSPSELKYDKKMTISTEKQQYIYRISDIHFEIDMSQLGCNSKILWHEIFFQIVDIISVKQEKIGIILCKNFHLIHTELLEVFYSYMQQYNHSQTNIKIKFFIITEQISFLPTTILKTCQLLRVKRPDKEKYKELSLFLLSDKNKSAKITEILNDMEVDGITNTKEIRSFQHIESTKELPKDVFNIICDNLINEILNHKKITFTAFRDTLYDILTYNLDMTETLWHILCFFIEKNYLSKDDVSDILIKTYTFLKYYNNNYRPIYHIESMMFYIINKIHNYDEL